MTDTLRNLNPGDEAVVTAILGNDRQRLTEMGITVGTHIKLRRVAPFGDPREFVVRGYSLLLGNDDAENILIEGSLGASEDQ